MTLLGSGHNLDSGLVTSVGAFEIFDVKNVTMIARITASKNGGVQAAQKGFGFASRKRSPGILKTS